MSSHKSLWASEDLGDDDMLSLLARSLLRGSRTYKQMCGLSSQSKNPAQGTSLPNSVFSAERAGEFSLSN